jgi:hemerythrin superfamily protein
MLPLSRRSLIAAAATTSAVFALRDALAQAEAAAGPNDWLAMVKSHHALVAKTFDQMLAAGNKTFLKRERMERLLSYELTAHSVAEENVLYPALARNGMLGESDKLYLDQAHAKVMNAELELVSAKDEATWFDRVRSLQAAVLKHAKEDEEATIYPKLQQALDAPQNALLARLYKREFDSVKPVRSPLA